jgi:cytochrome c oxidase subunit II
VGAASGEEEARVNELMRRILFLPEQASTLAAELDAFHYVVITVTMLGATGVALAVIVLVVRFRRREGGAGAGALRRSEKAIPLKIEVGAIAGLLVLFIAFWVVGYRQFIRFQAVPDGAIEVYVTGKQWMWTFAYPNGGGSNGYVYVPVGRPVKLIMTSRDVIHSFFVPDFRIKMDLVPGRTTVAWFEARRPGRYELLCAEYCGTSHSTMRGTVIALDDAEYEQALEGLTPLRVAGPTYVEPMVFEAARPEGLLSMAEMGERVAVDKGCLRCHTTDGTPHIGPTFAGTFMREVLLDDGRRIVADEAYLTESMMDPAAKVRAGFEPVMPSYRGLLTAAETGALVEFIRSLREVRPEVDWSPLPLSPDGPIPFPVPETAPEGATP